MNRWTERPKDPIPTQEDCNEMLDKLAAVFPMTKEELARWCIYKYYQRKKLDMDISGTHVHKHNMLMEQKHVCYYCKKYITQKQATFDHKLPLIRGGTSDPNNLCVCCAECNSLKSSMTEEEFWAFLSQELSTSLSRLTKENAIL